MKSRDGLAFALLAFLGNDATLTLAQYVTTVTVSVNTNPFCTPVRGVETPHRNGSGAIGPIAGSGSGASNSAGNITSTSSTSSSPVAPVATGNGQYNELGYYPAPADGNLLGGPVFSSPFMTPDLCGTDCSAYPYFAVENGDQCNCGSSAPSGAASSSPPSKNKRQVASGKCIPCAGDSTQCCGAPGGYAIVFSHTPTVEGTKATPTSYSPTSSDSVVAYASTASDGSVFSASTTYATTAGSTIAVASMTDVPITPTPIGYGGYGTGTSPNSISSAATGTIASGKNSTATGTVAHGWNGTATWTMAIGGSSAPTWTVTSGGHGAAPAIAANGGGRATTPKSPDATETSPSNTAEPTVHSPAPSCHRSANYVGNNTKYNDYFGYTYDIRCNLDVQSTPTDHDAYAESFEDCLEYCSLLTGCVTVTYQDPPYTPSNLSNCYPKWSFGGYTVSSADGVYSGVNVNGASPGTLQPQNICSMTDDWQGMSYAGQSYTDDYNKVWTIGCDNTLDIASATALSATVTDNLATCVDYCSRYDSCQMVNWSGPHTNGTADQPNCFPASALDTNGGSTSAPGAGYATLNQNQDD